MEIMVVLGVLQTQNGTEPEIQGYIYEFNEKSTQRDYSIKSLSLVSIEGMKVTFAWESEATMVEVRLLNAKNKQIGKMYTSEKQVSFNAPEVGKYAICVRPVDEDKQYLADEVKLVVEVDDYSVKDLALVSIDKLNRITFLPGDEILFKKGETFVGCFKPQGSGTETAPITIGSYGDGEVPLSFSKGAFRRSAAACGNRQSACKDAARTFAR